MTYANLTTSDAANATLARIETSHGAWTSYGGDGRTTTDAVDAVRQTADGTGWRARFIDQPHGGDYGWGPLAVTEEQAVILFLAEIAAAEEDAA